MTRTVSFAVGIVLTAIGVLIYLCGYIRGHSDGYRKTTKNPLGQADNYPESKKYLK